MAANNLPHSRYFLSLNMSDRAELFFNDTIIIRESKAWLAKLNEDQSV